MDRKVLAGAAVLFEAGGNAEFRTWLYGLLGRFLTRPDERELFGFEPLPARPELVVNRSTGEAEERPDGEKVETPQRETESA